MFRRLQIKNFRLFGDLKIDWLGRINLLGGNNNSGKTTVLEAIFLLCGGGNPELVLRINAFRGVTLVQGEPSVVSETYWKPLFSDLDMSHPVEITGKRAGRNRLALTIALERSNTVELSRHHVKPSSHEGHGVISKLQDQQVLRTGGEISAPYGLLLTHKSPGNKDVQGRIKVTQEGLQITRPTLPIPFPAMFLSSRSGSLQEDAVRLGQLRTRKQSGLLTKVLQIVEPRLQSVEDISASGLPMIWGDIGLPELVPLSAMGEGMTRIARIVLAISSSPGGVVLIDEIENGIHYSIMDKVWAVVAEAARQFNTQIVATTHSFECFRAAHGALNSDEWRYHRLDRTKDGTNRCVTFSPEDTEAAIRHGMEVR